jgi:hypothetical protein
MSDLQFLRGYLMVEKWLICAGWLPQSGAALLSQALQAASTIASALLKLQ